VKWKTKERGEKHKEHKQTNPGHEAFLSRVARRIEKG
jgi:hypothetical protein